MRVRGFTARTTSQHNPSIPLKETALPSALTETTAVDGSVLLVQLSDSHLFADAAAKLLGMDTG